MTRNDMFIEAQNAIIDKLNDGYTGYLADLHCEVFCMENYNNNTSESIDILDSLGGYSVVSECLEYEQDNFGEVSVKKYSNPVWVLSMYWFIIGEEALADLMEGVSFADDMWNEEMTEQDSETLAGLFEAKMGINAIS